MQRIAEAIKWLHPDADFRSNVRIENDGSGPRIVEWALGVNPPTDAQLQAAIAEIDAAGPPPELVKAEARRRILAAYPEWKQANMTARGVELMRIRMTRAWTADEQSEADALQAAWDWIKGIRTKSDALEAMRPIPSDYADDRHWS